MSFEIKQVPDEADAIAPDGSEVRLLCQTASGSMAHLTLGPGEISVPVVHRTVDEIWYIASGLGRMWLSHDGREEVADLRPGVSISLPVGTRFQFRCDGDEPLTAVGVTLPPWPGPDEAVVVGGCWTPTLSAAGG
ncbi:MAG: cupin domain-containing protein [Hyphomicrobiales bacterium]|nr:cupin domain-containing protein [Hyphomicrobiales bacterium]